MATDLAAAPILLELDDATWSKQIDRAAAWLGDALTVQEKFRKLAEDTAASLKEPHIKKYIQDIARHAAAHEELVRGLARAIGREPSGGRSLAGSVLAKGAELVADVVGLAGGARGNWKDLRQLLLASQDAMGAFAIAEQLGYALGLPKLSDPAFRAAAEKTRDHLVIQEFVLEMAPASILLHQDA
ncbi:hypothetical protein OJF2_70500 [Aquisphaera giovannonii]|uniref:Ferritin-like domain-containing protein n=1 Tax=Aquisphaera giovannonii TaxID=406548 RepID=A0A5B9WD56_9BACT|nr:hypothetical protein [Aquisphaera giovannonii]QEH38447.1 hypothetical protein OJF2_70500 [Aquisphaera giovannonii]